MLPRAANRVARGEITFDVDDGCLIDIMTWLARTTYYNSREIARPPSAEPPQLFLHLTLTMSMQYFVVDNTELIGSEKKKTRKRSKNKSCEN